MIKKIVKAFMKVILNLKCIIIKFSITNLEELRPRPISVLNEIYYVKIASGR